MTTATDARAVVAGIDGRPASIRAAFWAAQEAARRDVPLRLVAVTGTAGRDTAATDLTRARHVVEQAGDVVVTEATVAGPAGQALVSASHIAELVVLGARTPDGQVGETIGATSTHLLCRASCPVVVVPAVWDTRRRHEGEVVVAADPADPHGAAYGPVAMAADTAARWRKPMVATVVLPPEPGHREVARGCRLLDGILASVAACTDVAEVGEVVRGGEPAAALLDLVAESSGLLVLGAHGGATPSSSVLGQTCQAVVRWARCPVAVIPPGVAGARRPAVVGSSASSSARTERSPTTSC